jgi:hypothetical protein
MLRALSNGIGIRYIVAAGATACSMMLFTSDYTDIKLAFSVPTRLMRNVYTAALIVSGTGSSPPQGKLAWPSSVLLFLISLWCCRL